MVPAITEGGRSFKGAALYYLHDKRKPGEAERLTSDRVAWAHTLNLATDDPERAWRIMADTAMSQAELKAAAGEKATGRKLTKPVHAYSLAWHPEQRVDKETMLAAALESIKTQELEGYQAIIVAHEDEPQQHVHVLINRVHPDTGKAATLSNCKLKLSQWAEGYEKQQGKVYCQKRVENNERRRQGEAVREPRKPRHQYEVEAGNDSLSFDFIKSNQQQKDAALSELGRTIQQSHAKQWAELKRVYAAGRTKIYERDRAAKSKIVDDVKDRHKARWRMLFQTQKMEMRALTRREDSFLSRLFNGLSMLSEIRQKHDSRLMIMFALMTRKGQVEALETRHENERKALMQEIRDVTKTAQKQVVVETGAKLAELRRAFLQQCASLRETQDKQQAEQRDRWKVRNAERKAALAPHRRQRSTTRSRDVGRSRSLDPNTPRGGRRGPGMRPANDGRKPR